MKGDSDYWLGELEQNLSGKSLQSFQSLRDFDDTYEDVKDKLIAWYRDEEESRINKCKKKFKSAKPKKSKSLYLFATRLETIYKTAYPNQDPEMSNILSDQFKAFVSRKAKDAIKYQAMISIQ